MGAAWFFLSFLAVGILGADALTVRFETLPSDRIGAFWSLSLICFVASTISTFCYSQNSRRLGPRTRWSTGLLGGVLAAAVFCAPAGAFYAGLLNALGFWFWVALTIALPALLGWYWPLLSARQNSN